jgi:hypothetical protein
MGETPWNRTSYVAGAAPALGGMLSKVVIDLMTDEKKRRREAAKLVFDTAGRFRQTISEYGTFRQTREQHEVNRDFIERQATVFRRIFELRDALALGADTPYSLLVLLRADPINKHLEERL